MKKVFYIFLFVAVALTANSQDKKWNIGFGGGISKGQGDLKDFVNAGLDGYLNCTYNLAPKLAAGLEYNGSTFVGISLDGTDLKATKVTGVLLKGVYYFTESKVRPYAALMTGMYMTKVGVLGMDDLGNDVSEYLEKTKFGGGLELGLKIKWFNLGIGYHNIGKIEEAKVSYLQYNIGFNIGF